MRSTPLQCAAGKRARRFGAATSCCVIRVGPNGKSGAPARRQVSSTGIRSRRGSARVRAASDFPACVAAADVDPARPLLVDGSDEDSRASLLFLRRAAGADDVLLLDLLDVELRARRAACGRGRRRSRTPSTSRSGSELIARDDERSQVRAGEAAAFQFLRRSAPTASSSRQQFAPRAFALLERFGQRLVEEIVDAAQHRLIRAAAQPRALCRRPRRA